MNKWVELLEPVLDEWSYWSKAPAPAVQREAVFKEISLARDLVCVIQGVRRCGKSTLLSQIMSAKGLRPNSCYFVNFEDPRLSDVLDSTLLDAIVEYANKRSGSKSPRYFFFDEIQNVEQWEKWLRLKVDRPGRDYYVITGSNAALLSGDLGTVLTGRHITVELFPFSFAEYQLLQQSGTIESYLSDGGFPRALTIDEPAQLLRQYFSDIIERDVRRHVAVRSSLTLVQLAKAVFESLGSEASQRSLASTLGTTPDTVGSYLDACIQAYLILPCPYFSFSERQRNVRNRKFYPIDLGLRNAIITKGSPDLGKGFETIVFHALRKRYKDVFYWRGKGEVDFVVQDGTSILPFQVSWEGKKERHERAIHEFREKFPQAREAVFISRENIEMFFSTI